jgi:hypothetical protein
MRWSAVVGLGAAFLFVGVADAQSPQKPTLIDQYKAGCERELFQQHPNLAGFTTVGSLDGRRYAVLMDEVAHSFTRLETMMTDVGVELQDILEIRVELLSEKDRTEVAARFADEPHLAGIPFTYRVVDRLPVPWARVGFYGLADSPEAARRSLVLYGTGHPLESAPFNPEGGRR